MRPTRVLIGAVVLALPATAAGQGTVSAQGLGYPPGQYSTLTRSTAGAVAEFDPASPLNPASLANSGVTALFFHYAPETRRVSTANGTDDTRVQRFPLAGAIVPFSERGAVGLAVSTLLDRSWATTRVIDEDADGTGVVEHFSSRGAINDVRVAGAWSFSRQLQLGVGAHAFVGSNRVTASRVDQAGQDVPFEQQTEVGYSGLGASAGVLWNPSRLFSVGVSGQVGGTLTAQVADTTIAEATAPARGSVALRYAGITGAMLAARASWQGWSSLDDLGGENLDARDAWEYSVGADVEGPSVFGSPLTLRAGGRWRDLPFAALGAQPSEQSVTGGLGLILGRGRVLLDLAVERARREAAGASESAWTFGAGVTVRP
jgi:hypothetical protein